VTAHHTEVDEVVVHRLLRGERLDASRAELVAATAALMAENVTSREIADRLGKTDRSVQRYRKDVRTGRFAGLGGLVLAAAVHWPHGNAGALLLLLIVFIVIAIALLIYYNL